jgi:hypothetical protein
MAFPIAAGVAGMLMHHAHFDRALDLELRGELAEIRKEIRKEIRIELEDAIKNEIKAFHDELLSSSSTEIKAFNQELLTEFKEKIEKSVWGRRRYLRDYGAAVRTFKVLRLL